MGKIIMSKLCEAFNRINSRFGANRVKVVYLEPRTITVQIVELGKFEFGLGTRSVLCLEVEPSKETVRMTHNSQWLEAIANGKTRDEAGNMVDPK